MTRGTLLLMIAAPLLAAQSHTIPLEGLDPVALIQGQQLDGEKSLSVIRGGFQYLFANAANKAAFEKEPARYEIQLDGTCARMGPRVVAQPDLYTVKDGKLYVFGSAECKKRFEATPEKYLESQQPHTPFPSDPAGAAAARKMLDRAVHAMGATAVDGLKSFQEVRELNHETRTVLFPNAVRFNNIYTDNLTVDDVAKGDAAFRLVRGQTRDLPTLMAHELERDAMRGPLAILWAMRQPGFRAVKTSEQTADAEWFSGAVRATLRFDAETGRLASIKFPGRNLEGEFGEMEYQFSDYRAAGGLTLPYRIAATFNGQPLPQRSATITSIAINPTIDASFFEKAK